MKDNLILEAIAGTASSNLKSDFLLESAKDLKEHNYVIEYLIKCLQVLNINDYTKSALKVISFGDISHFKLCLFKD